MSNPFVIEAPIGWKKVPMWTIATRKDRKGYPDAELLSVYREYGVIRKRDRDDNHNVESEDLGNYKFVKKGDLVLNKMKTWQGSLGVSPYEGIVSPAYFTCELSEDVYAPFIHYLLRSQPYIAMYGAASKGIRVGQWDLPFEEFRDLPVLLPDVEVQQKIAVYLDRSISKIDLTVELITRLGIELRELRASVIDSLFPFAGVKGFEDIRENAELSGWQVCALGRLGKRVSHKGFSHLESLSVYLNLGVIPRSSRNDNKNELGADMSNYQRVQKGDLVFNKLRTWQGGFGVAQQEGIVSPAYFVFRFNEDKVIPEFIDLLLKSPIFLSEITRFTKWMPPSQFDTSWDDLKSLVCSFPSISEQEIILEKSKIVEQVRSLEKELTFLLGRVEELKSAIITHAVTGRLESGAEGMNTL